MKRFKLNKKLPKVLVACEESQAVTIELRKLGHEAYSCDIEPCSGGHPEWHLQQDVIPLLKEKWDMIIAFPPCTYLSNAGAARLYPHKGELNEERYKKGLEAKNFFMQFYNAKCPKIAIYIIPFLLLEASHLIHLLCPLFYTTVI